jgi:hypothetical protein
MCAGYDGNKASERTQPSDTVIDASDGMNAHPCKPMPSKY